MGFLGRGRGAVLLVGDVLAPGDRAAVLVVLLHADMDHEAVRRGAVPMILTGLEEHAVAGSDDLDGAALALAESGTLGHEHRLPVWVGVPRGAGARREVDVDGGEGRAAGGVGDRVDIDVAGEPPARGFYSVGGGAAGGLHGWFFGGWMLWGGAGVEPGG